MTMLKWPPLLELQFYLIYLALFHVALAALEANHLETNHHSQKYRRCRDFDHFGEIPWMRNTSTFYNLGYPLVRDLCSLPIKISSTKHLLGCSQVKSKQWLLNSRPASRSGDKVSTILVDPPCDDDGGASSGVFTINAMYPLLLGLGYKVRVRNWSSGLNSSFPIEAVRSAMNDSLLWLRYIKDTKNNPNPFSDVNDYISFQTEVGVFHYRWKNPQPEINNSPYSRELRWIIGYQKRASDPLYVAPKSHCIGANFFLGEGLHCASSNVIMCPMFPFHHQQSLKSSTHMKRNTVLIDGDAQIDIPADRLRNDLHALGLTSARVLVHEKRARNAIPELYKEVKVTIDCRNPGVEFINYESTLYNVLNLVCDSRATRNVFDFPVPSKYRVNPQSRWNEMVTLVHSLLVNYTDHIADFKYIRDLSRNSQDYVPKQLDIHLFSRDVLFRTYCATYSECRHVFPWALSVWVLFPLARIEVFTDLALDQFELDNDILLELLSHAFDSRFFKVIQWNSHGGFRSTIPAVMLPSFPCTHVLYMSPYFILFGRDFLNEHMAALESAPGPITYFSAKGELLIAFSKATEMIPSVTYWSTTKTYKSYYYEIFILKGGKRHMIDWKTFVDIGYNTLMDVPGSAKADVMKLPEGGPMDANATLGHLMLAPLPLVEKPALPNLPLDMLLIHDKEAGPYSTPTAELWISSSIARMKISSVLHKFRYPELNTLVAHLDPVLESSYFKKAYRYFPHVVQTVLSSFDVSNYAEVVSLRDAYYPRWGETCSGSQSTSHSAAAGRSRADGAAQT